MRAYLPEDTVDPKRITLTLHSHQSTRLVPKCPNMTFQMSKWRSSGKRSFYLTRMAMAQLLQRLETFHYLTLLYLWLNFHLKLLGMKTLSYTFLWATAEMDGHSEINACNHYSYTTFIIQFFQVVDDAYLKHFSSQSLLTHSNSSQWVLSFRQNVQVFALSKGIQTFCGHKMSLC